MCTETLKRVPSAALPQAYVAARQSDAGQRAAEAVRSAVDRAALEAQLRAAQRYLKQAHARVRRAVLTRMRAVAPLRKYATPEVADALLLALLLPGLLTVASLPFRLLRWLFGRGGRKGRKAQRGAAVPQAVSKKSAALTPTKQGQGSSSGKAGRPARG